MTAADLQIGTSDAIRDRPNGAVPARGNRNIKLLALVFLLTLPLVNPWVRGDGVGYYSYVRSMLVEHRLDFSNDWRSANESFGLGRFQSDGSIDPRFYTATGHLENHFTVGPAMLWTPVLAPVHAALLILHSVGLRVATTGYSKPYLIAMALATALYGFLGLLISFQMAGQLVRERWALLATFGIWFASSLPVYMYFNPSWSHAHSVLAVALFLWYWLRTRIDRTPAQWAILGLISGVVLDVYYANIAVLMVPLCESLTRYGQRIDRRDWDAAAWLLLGNIVYCVATIAAFLPTLITRKIIYGSPFQLGYAGEWMSHPALAQVLFSSDHGLLVWTPILIISLVGLFLLRRHDPELSTFLLVSSLAFYLIVSFHSNWDGISSFGNRFFISLTPFFVLGLAISLQTFASFFKNGTRAWHAATVSITLLIVWNMAFIFQWGTHLVPSRGPICWRQMVRNQFTTVPIRASTQFAAYFQDRRGLMNHIEQQDVRSLKDSGSTGRADHE